MFPESGDELPSGIDAAGVPQVDVLPGLRPMGSDPSYLRVAERWVDIVKRHLTTKSVWNH